MYGAVSARTRHTSLEVLQSELALQNPTVTRIDMGKYRDHRLHDTLKLKCENPGENIGD